MAEIAILPLSSLSRFGGLFERPVSAEGSYGWFQCLAEITLEPGEEAVVAVALDDGVARAALPLVRMGPSAIRALTAPYTTLYAPALPEPQWARFLGAGAQTYVAGSLHLDALDPRDPGIAAYVQGLASSGLMAAQYRHFVNWYEPVAGFDEYWNARPSRLRATVRRKLALARAASPEFLCYREGPQLDHAVTVYEDIYRSSWKPAEPHPDFISNMVRRLAKDGLVRLGVMMLAAKPVAAQIWLVCDRKATIFKLAHRQDAADYSPGTLLTHWMISTLSGECGLDEIDFGRGNDDYKRDWLNSSRLRTGLVAGNWRSRAGLGVIVREVLPTGLSAVLSRSLDTSLRMFGLPRAK